MKFLRIFFAIFLATLYFVLSTCVAHAQSEFSVDATVLYDVQDSGKTVVTHNITLENNFSTLYATTYSLGLENIDTQNIIALDEKGKPIPVDVQKDGPATKIIIKFSDAVVGKGAQRHFSVSYENGSFAVRTGEIWEVSVPRLSEGNSFRSYKIILKVPSSFGLEAYISPKPKSSQSDYNGLLYTFDRSSVAETGISGGFGQFQVFAYSLSYHLENPLGKSAQTQIALPPDTAFQKVYLQKIDPKPSSVNVDTDGNWLATYILSPRQRVDVTVAGVVQIFAGFRTFPKPTDAELSDNLRETEYWQVGNPQIKSLAAELRTPKAIYDYVVKTLKYDFNRVQPNVQRMGAVNALQNPSQAICMEFTDLFIAIARAAGIPAREINGYAYTENPELQPLSLVADLLHAWPEYYDKDKGIWIPVDPTWASTSGGINYFDKLDLRHFAFVIHGESPVMPYPPGSYKLGPNPQKDVYVSFGKLPENRISSLNISIIPVRILPFLNSIYTVKIYNAGPQAMYSVYSIAYFDNKESSRDFIEVLPPYSTYKVNITVPFSILGKGSPNIVEVKAGGSSARITTNKTQVIIHSLLAISAFLIILVIFILIKLKKITFGR
ncbi:MAG: transglutaminase-like domain-containing protein, partial [Candidatus Woesebacteria bacterium]|nr:transglutaminase-like domain-containing protein [Candidatus Woesebacteria bacterium]